MTNQKTPVQGGELRERIVNALVMSPLSDYAGVDLTPFSRTADMILEALPEPVQGTPTEEQIEAAARAMWDFRRRPHEPEWKALEYGVQEEYRKDARAALSASASANPAGEHDDAEEREAESEELRDAIDHIRGAVDFQDSINPEAVKVLIDAVILERPGVQDPKTGELVAEAREWAKYDATGASKIVIALCDALSNQAESEDHAATVTGDREKLIAEAVAKGLNHLWGGDAHDGSDWRPDGNEAVTIAGFVRAALAAPVEIDGERLAAALSEHVGWEPLGYDDRKELASIFQNECALPSVGLSHVFYDALIAVANAGYDRAREHALAAAADAAARADRRRWWL